MWADLRAERARVLAGVMYAVLFFGVLWVFSAIGLDSGDAWDTVARSTNAVVGVGLLGLGVPFGVAALVFDRRDRGECAPGQTPPGLRRPHSVVGALLGAVVLMGIVLAALGGHLVP